MCVFVCTKAYDSSALHIRHGSDDSGQLQHTVGCRDSGHLAPPESCLTIRGVDYLEERLVFNDFYDEQCREIAM